MNVAYEKHKNSPGQQKLLYAWGNHWLMCCHSALISDRKYLNLKCSWNKPGCWPHCTVHAKSDNYIWKLTLAFKTSFRFVDLVWFRHKRNITDKYSIFRVLLAQLCSEWVWLRSFVVVKWSGAFNVLKTRSFVARRDLSRELEQEFEQLGEEYFKHLDFMQATNYRSEVYLIVYFLTGFMVQ